ncbi:MAG: threonine synthase [Candidatus Methanomethylicota archaeon]|uniref:Threonine synthase n=1 Tax=Thermoproteota archaeon TaxID=2056631 RepID=A0A497EZ22_9CREN|nr:MAG: threonine synthase [Candidatus Verstraetearchaeota archaeon]
MVITMYVKCSLCGELYSYNIPLNTCNKCGGVLLFKYDYNQDLSFADKKLFENRPRTFWKFFDFLPLSSAVNVTSIGELFTPLMRLPDINSINLKNIYIKDDSRLPTGTFKARGMSIAVSCLKELGVKRVAIPSAGNAAAALAAYGARAGMEVYTFIPKDAPLSTLKECIAFGAKVYLIDGLIGDAASIVSRLREKYGWFDLSTNKQPYRFEGYKLMAFEIAEQFDWHPPDVIVFPTGGGEGVIGLWKGFNELVELGWINESEVPRLIIVQSTGCAPLVKAFREGKSEVEEPWPNARTIAAGLRVPKPFGSYLVLRAVRETDGYAVAVSDEEILSSMRTLAHKGLFVCPEAAATHAALPHLRDEGVVDRSDRILLYLTGSGLKYLDLIEIGFSQIPVLGKDAYSLPTS